LRVDIGHFENYEATDWEMTNIRENYNLWGTTDVFIDGRAEWLRMLNTLFDDFSSPTLVLKKELSSGCF
jgi:hypothetical protein